MVAPSVKNLRFAAISPGPGTRATISAGAALTTRVMARAETRDTMATILKIFEERFLTWSWSSSVEDCCSTG